MAVKVHDGAKRAVELYGRAPVIAAEQYASPLLVRSQQHSPMQMQPAPRKWTAPPGEAAVDHGGEPSAEIVEPEPAEKRRT